ncbi:MAG: hypothetical protein HUJ97_03915 [Bacteroidales bacterium]|nr:hypothetical protein [Bacteroidales bacterium]
MNKLKDSYTIRLRCATCGCEDQFEINDDESYVKCTFCNREYFGGIEELKECNQEVFDEVQDEIKQDAADYIKEQLSKALKGNKYIKFK